MPRLYPHGWARPGFPFDEGWFSAMELDGSPNQPSISTDYPQYPLDPDRGPSDAQLRPRSIPLMRESVVSVSRLSESYLIHWDQTPENYFDFRVPGAFHAERAEVAVESSPGEWRVNLNDEQAAALTFELSEQIVGWPGFTIEAPAGTVIELLVQEAHALGGPPLLNTHFDSWTRFICREGINDFETFEFESLRAGWIISFAFRCNLFNAHRRGKRVRGSSTRIDIANDIKRHKPDSTVGSPRHARSVVERAKSVVLIRRLRAGGDPRLALTATN